MLESDIVAWSIRAVGRRELSMFWWWGGGGGGGGGGEGTFLKGVLGVGYRSFLICSLDQ